MRRLDKNRVVRFRYKFEEAPAGTMARVLKFVGDEEGEGYEYALQLPPGFAGHKANGLLKTWSGYFAPRDVLEPTRVKVSGAREFNRRYKFTPLVEEGCASKA